MAPNRRRNVGGWVGGGEQATDVAETRDECGGEKGRMRVAQATTSRADQVSESIVTVLAVEP